MKFPDDKCEQLVASILAGEAVFFVGAGFSLDSEGNTAKRLIARLLARFMALVEYADEKKAMTEDFRIGLRRTFNLKEDEEILSEAVIGKLGERYFDINDWIVSAFEVLLRCLENVPDASTDLRTRIRDRENELLRECRLGSKCDPVRLAAMESYVTDAKMFSARERAKALFLDTMGFLEPSIMAGDPAHNDLQQVMSDYLGIVRDRHRVLARLAREGLCPLLLTTNYDLLLEGAFRLAGFEVPPFRCSTDHGPRFAAATDEESDDVAAGTPKLKGQRPERAGKPLATFDRLYRVGAPTDFFERGAAYRSALLVKIHGCAHRYRLERASGSWKDYLSSIVFTYREIQNWRKDSWSRDLVTTLLRTRTMVLCGYSGIDPVIHDTFRTVYEEISAQHALRPRSDSAARPEGTLSAVGAVPGERGRAFFTGGAVSREFHGLEILRAASRAAGNDSPNLTDHPNYLPFFFLQQRDFPTLDELMVWIFHRVMRELQRSALQTDLRRTASQLLGRPIPEGELEAVRENFDKLDEAERRLASDWSDGGNSRRQFSRVAGWTDRFHTALLREFALAETVQRNQGPGLRLEHLRAARCYFPVLDQPGWAAWGVVLEMALRRMSQALRTSEASPNEAVDWTDDHEWVEPALCEYPAILISQRRDMPSPMCLLLRFAGFERPGYRPDIRGVYKRLTTWELKAGIEARRHRQAARDTAARDAPARASPGADDVWRWATASVTQWTARDLDDVNDWFGNSSRLDGDTDSAPGGTSLSSAV